MRYRNCLIFIFWTLTHVLQSQIAFIEEIHLGETLVSEGKYREALLHLKKAEQDTAWMNTLQKRALYVPMALCYRQTSNYVHALRCYDILDNIGYNKEKNALGRSNLMLMMGQYDAAVELLQYIHFKNENNERERIINLANAMARRGDIEEAISLLLGETSELLKDRIVNKSSFVLHNNLGFIYLMKGDYEQAELYLKKALTYYNTKNIDFYHSLGNLAVIESYRGKAEEALEHINSSLSWVRQQWGGTSEDYNILLRKKAEIYVALNQKDEAVLLFKEYFDREQELLLSLFATMDASSRQNYWSSKQPLFARIFSAESTNEADFLYRVALFEKSMQFIDDENGDIRKLIEITTRDVQEALPDTNSIAIEFVRYEKKGEMFYAAITLRKEGIARFIPLFSETDIQNYLVGGHRLKGTLLENIIEDRSRSAEEQAKEFIYTDEQLGNMIWCPILDKESNVQNIFFSPEGIFNLLAIEYLPGKYADKTFYRLSSTRVLLEARKRRNDIKNILLIGDVEYTDTACQTQPLEDVDRRGSILFCMDNGMEPSFDKLLNSRSEVETISQSVVPSIRRRIVVCDDPTEQFVKTELPNFQIALISTHGYCSSIARPKPVPVDADSLREDLSLLRCGLAFAGCNKYSRQLIQNNEYEDGILTAQEMSRMNLNDLDLLALSACQTALGTTQEDGMTGLPRGLKKAGVKTLVVTLWHVDDKASSIFMKEFFRILCNEQMVTKQEAFLRAQRYVRQEMGSLYSKPFYWAPFIIIDGIL